MTPRPTPSARPPAGLLVGACVIVASYAAQRLWAASGPSGAVDGSIIASVHIPYYWRCGTALFHGVAAGALAAWALREPEATRVLGRAGLLVALAVIPSAIAMLVVP